MKKNSKKSGQNFTRKTRLPTKDEQFAVVIEMSGGSRLRATCEDGKTRMIRIGGKLKKRMWVNIRKNISHVKNKIEYPRNINSNGCDAISCNNDFVLCCRHFIVVFFPF